MKKQPNILLTRIDNRLIHGQVGVVWTTFLGANLIVVANDRVANDETQQALLDMAVGSGVQTRYFSLQKTIDVINKASPSQKILLLIENPQDALTLVQGGIPIDSLNVGNMHFVEGKKQITSFIYMDDKDIECIKSIIDLGVEVDIRKVPTDSMKKINDLI